MASAIPDLPMRGSLPGLPFMQARLARASPEASIAGSFLLQLMRILIEEKGSAAAGDAARKLVVTIGGAALQLNTVAFVATQDRSRLRVILDWASRCRLPSMVCFYLKAT